MPSILAEQRPQRWGTKTKVLRRLGINESYQIALQTLGQYRGTLITSRLVVPPLVASSLENLQSVIENAIGGAILKHPLMQVGLIGETTKKPAWIRLDSLDLRRHIDWQIIHEGEDFQYAYDAIVQIELDTKFSNFSTTPGWRIVVLHQEDNDFVDTLFTFNHANMDGVSVKIFLEDFLQTLSQQAADPSGLHPDINNGILTLPRINTGCTPPAENLTEFPIDRDPIIKALWSQLKSSLLSPVNPTQANWATIQRTTYKTKFRYFTLNNATLTDLIGACRNSNTTITGLLHALSLASLSFLLEDSKASAFESLTALDIRRFLPEKHPEYMTLNPSRTMANYVTILNHFFDVSSVSRVRSKTSFVDDDGLPSHDLLASIWSVAANTRQQIKGKLDQGLKNDMIGFMKSIDNWRAVMSRAVTKPRRASWVVTNLGVMDSHSPTTPGLGARSGSDSSSISATDNQIDNGWSIRQAQFVLSANIPAAALSISPIAVKGGSLCVTVSWQESVLEEGLGERFVGDLERWMRFLARGGEVSLSDGEYSMPRNG